jgi:hypothetical protein
MEVSRFHIAFFISTQRRVKPISTSVSLQLNDIQMIPSARNISIVISEIKRGGDSSVPEWRAFRERHGWGGAFCV